MTRRTTVCYVGTDATALDSFLPTVDDADVLGTVTASTDAALSYLRTDAVDCLVVDTRTADLDPSSFLPAVRDAAGDVPVLLVIPDETTVDVAETAYDRLIPASASEAARRAAVLDALASGPSGPGRPPAASILEASLVATVVITEGDVTWANHTAETLFGFDDAGQDPLVERITGRLYDESGEPISASEFPARQILSKGDSVLGYTPGDETQEQPQRWLLVNGNPLPGESTSVVLTFKDVTWLKEHQNELERRRRELDEAVRELKQSNAELEQFAYVASHDLREPLRMVSNYLGLLDRRYGSELDDDARDFIEYAIEGAQRMRRFINDLLEYSRIGRDDGEMTAVDLDTVVETVQHNLEVRLAETDSEVIVEDLPTVHGDEHRLEQLFQNLLSNAIEHAGEQPPRIEIGATRQEEYCEVHVADEGVGIDDDGQDRAFDLFYTTGDHEGTGIGLSICRKIVRSHGGRIWLDSAPGAGTTIYFTLVPEDAPNPEARVDTDNRGITAPPD